MTSIPPDDVPDPITVLRVSLATDPPGRARFYLCPRSLARRLVADSARSADQLADLGPAALLIAQAAGRKRAEYGRGAMVLVGISQGDRWLAWVLPSPREAVPGSPGATAARN